MSISLKDSKNLNHLITFTTGKEIVRYKQIVLIKFASTRRAFLTKKFEKNHVRLEAAIIQWSLTELCLNCTNNQSEKTSILPLTLSCKTDKTPKKVKEIIICRKYKLRRWLMRSSWNSDKAIWPTTSLVFLNNLSFQTENKAIQRMANASTWKMDNSNIQKKLQES